MGNATYNKLTNIYINKNYNNTNIDKKEIFFENNPNIRFKKKILESDEYNYKAFTYFYSIIENRHNLVIGTNNFNINVLTICDKENIQLIKILEGHKTQITELKYFSNDNLVKEEYLLSAENKFVFIWDINNNYNIIFKINTKYSNKSDIMSCLMLFNIFNTNYIVTSSYQYNSDDENGKDYTQLYSFKNKKYKFIKNYPGSNNNQTCHLISWHNQKSNNYYLIECCKDKIDINNLITKIKYAEFNSPVNDGKKVYFNYGIIYNNKEKDFLLCSLSTGIISVWNLESKNLIDFLYLNDCWSGNIIRWNKRYIIVVDKHQKSFKVIDLHNLTLISNIIFKKKSINCLGYNSIVKIDYPGYGESIITLSLEDAELWSSII